MTTNETPLQAQVTARPWNVGMLATARAKAAGDPVVDTRHILYGLVAESDGVSGVVLREFGLDTSTLETWSERAGPDDDISRVFAMTTGTEPPWIGSPR